MYEIDKSDDFLVPSDISFRQGWREVQSGRTKPISELWDSIEAEDKKRDRQKIHYRNFGNPDKNDLDQIDGEKYGERI